jgi:C4-dicarboxylate-specific signal transduction histidine kinase
MDLQNFNWRVLNKKDLLALLTQLNKKPDPNFSIFILDSSGFKMLDSNVQEMRRFIEEQQAVIQYYQKLEVGQIDSLHKPLIDKK